MSTQKSVKQVKEAKRQQSATERAKHNARMTIRPTFLAHLKPGDCICGRAKYNDCYCGSGNGILR